MVFSSITFLCFFLPIVVLLYFACNNPKYRNAILIISSLIFYTWGATKWVLVMLLTVFVNYLCGIFISQTKRKGVQRLWMLLGVCLGIGFLIYFKYSGFLVHNISSLFHLTVDYQSPILPIGISFYTFQVLTYTIDVYKGKVPVQKNFFLLLLYVSFFPQLIAGPIVNYKDIEASLVKRKITIKKFYEGLMRFFIGFSKKILIANVCGEIVDGIGMTGQMSVLGAWLGALAYTFQIYFDFSGYSDMAIGMGKMFGFKFLENFNYPYISKSITEFWRRWHMSLGAFFREYVYIPLGGNRVSKLKNIRNIAIVWALTGIWHGASWNFLLWGLYYGVLLILEKIFFMKVKDKLPACINVVVTFLIVNIGWVIFYHTNLSDVVNHLGIMFGAGANGLIDAKFVYYAKHYLGFLILAFLASLPWKEILYRIRIKDNAAISALKAVCVSIITILAIGMLIGQSYNPFLYFRF